MAARSVKKISTSFRVIERRTSLYARREATDESARSSGSAQPRAARKYASSVAGRGKKTDYGKRACPANTRAVRHPNDPHLIEIPLLDARYLTELIHAPRPTRTNVAARRRRVAQISDSHVTLEVPDEQQQETARPSLQEACPITARPRDGTPSASSNFVHQQLR
jgi:hypothetical protein